MANFNSVGNALTGVTGTGTFVGATSPTLVTPLLGTPTSGTLTNCTGLPVAGGGTGIASATAYSVLCGGTTTTGAFQPLAALGATGSQLTSGGASALPSFKGGLTSFHAYRNSTQSINNITFTKCQLATERFDTGGLFDNATNYRYTPNIAGKYMFVGGIFFSAFADRVTVIAAIYFNGAAIADNISTTSTAVTTDIILQASTIYQMNGSTDYVELFVYQGSGGAANLQVTHSFLAGCLLEAD